MVYPRLGSFQVASCNFQNKIPDLAFHANLHIAVMAFSSFSEKSIIFVAKTLRKVCTKDGFLFTEDIEVAFKHLTYLVNFWDARFCFLLQSTFNPLMNGKIVKRRKDFC